MAGTIRGEPLTRYDVDLFANDAFNMSGFGDGQSYLQSLRVVTDVDGTASFHIRLDVQNNDDYSNVVELEVPKYIIYIYKTLF